MKNFLVILIIIFTTSAHSVTIDFAARISGAGGADEWVYFSGPGDADEWWYIVGPCASNPTKWIYPSGAGGADKRVYISGPVGADKWVCITNADELDYEMQETLSLR